MGHYVLGMFEMDYQLSQYSLDTGKYKIYILPKYSTKTSLYVFMLIGFKDTVYKYTHYLYSGYANINTIMLKQTGL